MCLCIIGHTYDQNQLYYGKGLSSGKMNIGPNQSVKAPKRTTQAMPLRNQILLLKVTSGIPKNHTPVSALPCGLLVTL